MKKYIFLASAVVALAACSSNEEIEQIGKCEIKLSSTLEVQTRAAQGIQSTEFDQGQRVDVFINEDTDEEASIKYDQPLYYTTGANGVLNPPSTQYFPQNGNGVNIIGLYPSGLTTDVEATNVSFSVQSNQSDSASYKASDLMIGTPVGNNPVARTTSSIALKFKHYLSKININITAGDGLTTNDLVGAEVTILGITNSATFNVQTGVVTLDKQPASSTITAGTLAKRQDNGEIAGISAIVIPQEVTAGSQFISIKIGGDQQTAPTELVYTLPKAASMTFNPGYSYTFNITAKKSGLSVNSSSISQWEDGGSTNGEAIPMP